MSTRVVRTIEACRGALAPVRRAGEKIGFVPTMGWLHEGHLSLVDEAREAADRVVVSIFVNPIQFDSTDDLDAYPRDLDRDVALASERGADLVFAPSVEEMYPAPPKTTVTMSDLTERYEGAARPGHFDGVLTVVTKLFHIVEPDLAVFGRKDAQQAAVVRRLIDDLDFDVELLVAPTVREPDGLAASSRNVRLSEDERRRAAAIPRALFESESAFEGGQRDATEITASVREALEAAGGIDVEYAAVVDPDRFVPIETIDRPCLAVVAARVGEVRLIDNVPLDPTGGSP